MCDSTTMDLRSHVRRLTMAALQFPRPPDCRPDIHALKAHIEHQCVTLSLSIQDGRRTNSIANARAVAGSLGSLLMEANRRGLLGSFELALMVRELSFVNESLATLPGQ
jgi:hypothetical protein